MKPSSDIWFRIDFEISLTHEDGEPSDFITVYSGSVTAIDENEEQKIGKVCVYIVERNRAINERRSLFNIMDSLDADSFDCFESLFDVETEELKESIEKLRSEDRMFHYDLMLMQRLELEPEWRGLGIGKRVALRIIEKLGDSVGLIVCKPFPLQFTGLGRNEKQPTGIRSAQKAVRDFWQDVGFIRIPRTDYYIWPT